jgi:dihydroneopterin aldolase
LNDTIRIIGLKFSAKHGVLPEEKTLIQPFEVDIEIIRDLSLPAASDRLEDTVNYSRVISLVKEVVNGEQCALIERLAGRIIERLEGLLDKGEVIVRVRKPRAPVDIQFDSIEVELRRGIHH